MRPWLVGKPDAGRTSEHCETMASGQARRQPEERASRRPRSGVVEDGRHMRANRPRAVSRSRFVPPGLSPKDT